MVAETKTCSDCGELKSVSEFYAAHTKDGLNSRCKLCIREAYVTATAKRVTRRNITQKYIESLENRGIKSPEDYMARAWATEQEWRKEKLALGLCSRCGKKPLWNKTSCMDCFEKRTNSQKEKEAIWIAKGLCRKDGKDYAEPPTFLCVYHEAIAKNRSRHLRKSVIRAYGGRCACCGEREERFLTIDHVNNDGSEKRKQGADQNGDTFYRQLLKVHRIDLQLLCWNCNLGKYHNGGQCPHVLRNEPPQLESKQDWYAFA